MLRRCIVPLIFFLTGFVVLVSLAVWQLQRLEWKEEALSRIRLRLDSPPVDLPNDPDPQNDKYLSVKLSGHFVKKTLRVLSGQKHIGAGYLLISPFETTDGRRVLVQRDFVSVDDPVSVPPDGQFHLRGNLLWPDDRNYSTPDNDVDDNLWFARDVEQMASVMQTRPLLIIARDIKPVLAGIRLVPVDLAHIPNNHMQYAITWSLLALVWLVMTVYFLRKQITSEGK